MWIDIHHDSNNSFFQFQVNAVGGSGFDETITSTFFRAYNQDSGGGGDLTYQAAYDQAQGTAYQYLSRQMNDAADEAEVGELHLFNPASTTYVKNFYSISNVRTSNDMGMNNFAAGYINTTAAIDEITFKMDTGNFDGTIKMYGIAS